MHDLTFSSPDLSSFCQLDTLGLVATGQHLTARSAVIECRFTKPPEPCPKCGACGASRGTVTRRLAHVPYGHRSTALVLRVRRWSCTCGCFWLEDSSSAASPRSKLSYGAIRWALAAIVLDHLSVSRVAASLGVAWHTANNAIISEGKRLLFNDPARFDNVRVLGVDEHVWRHTRRGDKYVTIVVDLTPVRNKIGPARLLDVLEGRSKQAFKQWLQSRPKPGLKALPWMVFQALNPQRKKFCPAPKPCWTLSMWCAGQATCWTTAVGVFSKKPWGAEGIKTIRSINAEERY